MVGQLFNSIILDDDGRQFVLSDGILDVHYYNTAGESWDRTGGTTTSWYKENYLPNDLFDSSAILSDRWEVISTTSESIYTQTNDSANFSVTRNEGEVVLSSKNKWKLTGDFDIRLYIDWDSYYNEYRSITHSFLKVAVDEKNASRLSFSFNGTDKFLFVTEKAVNRDLTFFDWLDNGADVELSNITEAKAYRYFRIVRTSGTLQFFIVSDNTELQVGEDVSDAVFSGDVYIEFGIEAKEYNTYRTSFTRFFVASGELATTTEFFSSSRGRRQEFPESSVIVVDSQAVSIIDDQQNKLWMRAILGDVNLFPDSSIKAHACEGVIYFATTNGLVVFDFTQDKIYKYLGSDIFEAEEPISLRNAGANFDSILPNKGTLPDAIVNDVSCSIIGSDTFIAVTGDSGVSVFRPLVSGIAISTDGPLPAQKVEFSANGNLWWSGYDVDNNLGELSSYSSPEALISPGDNTFFRDDFFGTDTALSIFGHNIQAFDVRSVSGVDIIAVGTTEGITFIGFSPAALATESKSYGIISAPNNPFSDPSFENPLGLYWKPFVSDGFLELFRIERSTNFPTAGDYSLRLQFKNLVASAFYPAGMKIGVYQNVDLTGINAIYFDSRLDGNISGEIWDFEVLVDDTVIKSYPSNQGSFLKLNDFAIIPQGLSGVHKVTFQLRIVEDIDTTNIGLANFYVDNIKTKVGSPDYEILSAGSASVNEVLLQYEGTVRKIYFSALSGYGAVDLEDNSLDFFVPIITQVEDSTIDSADFSKIEDEI